MIELEYEMICAFCLDMHWKDARELGETEERPYMLVGWRESQLYNARERVAFEPGGLTYAW